MAKKNRIKNPENASINGCRVKPNNGNAFPFASDILVINGRNQIGIEFNDDRIRVDGVVADSYEHFAQMLDAVSRLAQLNEYPTICFIDELRKKYRKMFRKYGFKVHMSNRYIFSCSHEVPIAVKKTSKETLKRHNTLLSLISKFFSHTYYVRQ